MGSHEEDIQTELQAARAEIIRLNTVAHHISEDGTHAYTSTYCLHGQHGNCRLTCKICRSPCLYGCGHEVSPTVLAQQPPTV